MKKTFCHPPLDMIYVTQHFGENPKMYKQFNMDGHNGVDFRTCFEDSPNARREVFAVDNGVVSRVVKSDNGGYGWHVRIKHEDGSETLYAHLCKIVVERGDKVSAGEVIAVTGNTGFSTGPHLHFGYRPADPDFGNGFAGYIDPMDLFDFSKYDGVVEWVNDEVVKKDEKKDEKKNEKVDQPKKKDDSDESDCEDDHFDKNNARKTTKFA